MRALCDWVGRTAASKDVATAAPLAGLAATLTTRQVTFHC